MAFTPKLLQQGASGASGYQISRSLRFNSADSAYLNRTPAVAGNRQIWTWSGWVKFGTFKDDNTLFSSGSGVAAWSYLAFNSSSLTITETTAGAQYTLVTTQVFRDPSAWYHIVVAVDTTQATSSNRIKFYVNGSQITSFSTANYPTQNYNTYYNSATQHGVGRLYDGGGGYYFNGYMTEVNFIDGQALTPSSFGSTNAQTGVWQPKAYSGTYGTNGFYLNFSDNSNTTAATLGKDYSGNGNNWTPNNFSVTAGAGNDSLVDTPTPYGTDTGVGGEVRGNYATWNPLAYHAAPGGTGVSTFSDGNLTATTTGSVWSDVFSTIAVSSGKWYSEFSFDGGDRTVGIFNVGRYSVSSLTDLFQGAAGGYGYYNAGQKYNNGTGVSYGASYTTGDIIGVALDLDGGNLTFYKNGVSQGVAYTGLSGTFVFAMSAYFASAIKYANFGQRPFAYTAPSGYKALCTQNLPTPTIGATSATLASQFFAPTLWTGDGTNNRTIVTGLQSDFVWIKRRDAALSHQIFDAVRGAGKVIYSDTADAEVNQGAYYVQQFNSNNFLLGSTDSAVNAIGATYVAWNWNAGGSTVSNTTGSISSQVRANPTAGFSVVTYTGQSGAGTVGHGLGVAPSMIIVKSRSNNQYGWAIWHSSFTQNEYILFDTSAKVTGSTSYWNSSAPSTWTSAFGVGSQPKYVNNSGDTFVAYCWAQVPGYSAIATYTGNGSADGPFVFTGFRPAFLLIRSTGNLAGYHWFMFDNKRDPYNVTQNPLGAASAAAEPISASGYRELDMLSNGFKIRASGDQINYSTQTYIYMAFADNPFKYVLAR